MRNFYLGLRGLFLTILWLLGSYLAMSQCTPPTLALIDITDGSGNANDATLCGGNNEIFALGATVTNNQTVSYQWSVDPIGAVNFIDDQANFTGITSNYSGNGPLTATITITATSGPDCIGTQTTQIDINPLYDPNTPSILGVVTPLDNQTGGEPITGPIVCPGNFVTLSPNLQSGDVQFTWSSDGEVMDSVAEFIFIPEPNNELILYDLEIVNNVGCIRTDNIGLIGVSEITTTSTVILACDANSYTIEVGGGIPSASGYIFTPQFGNQSPQFQQSPWTLPVNGQVAGTSQTYSYLIEDGTTGCEAIPFSVTVTIPDSDGDGIEDACDACPNSATGDSDGDGICDNEDICAGGDDHADNDNDGTPNFCDACPDSATGDSDGDGVCDNEDICAGGDDYADDDGDLIPNFCDACPNAATGDTDKDGICDDEDNCISEFNPDQADSNNNGIGDACETTICDNVTDGGQISGGETVCSPDVVGDINNVVLPSGGSGALEYIWLSTTYPELPINQWTTIAGADQPNYSSGTISETTYFIRCSRRAGCTIYEGESNIITKRVNGESAACDNGAVSTSESGSASFYFSNSGVAAAGNLLGTPDGFGAALYDDQDQLVVGLEHEIAAGDFYTIVWKHRNYTPSGGIISPAKMVILESGSGNYFTQNTIISTEVKQFYVSTRIQAQTDTRYLLLANRDGFADFEIDAIVYCNEVCPSEHCAANGNDTYYEWIRKVRTGSINNNSGNNNGYGDFTNLSTSMNSGYNYAIRLKPGFRNASYREYWRVWVDWNQDGDFDDQGELEVQARSYGTVNRIISVPGNATSGTTRMRVAMKYGGYPNACGSFGSGEVEDYSIEVNNSSTQAVGSNIDLPIREQANSRATDEDVLEASVESTEKSLEPLKVEVFPNPAINELNIRPIAEMGHFLQLQLFHISGKLVREQSMEHWDGRVLQLNTSDLVNGMYTLMILTKDHQPVAKQVVIQR